MVAAVAVVSAPVMMGCRRRGQASVDKSVQMPAYPPCQAPCQVFPAAQAPSGSQSHTARHANGCKLGVDGVGSGGVQR